MRKRARIGDVIEIPTNKGFAYALYTHNVPNWGQLLKVLLGFHQEKPISFASLVEKESMFITFFPLQAALKKKIFQIVSSAEIPPKHLKFPIFKNSISNGASNDWWLWDGENEWFEGKLTEAQISEYPDLGVCTDLYLVEKLETEF